MDFREKSEITRKRSLSVDNEYSLIIRKIRGILRHLKHDSDIFTYKEIRVIRQELWKIKKNYKKFLDQTDLENITDIENILKKLKTSHPHLCCKESFLSFVKSTQSESTKDDVNDKQPTVKKGSGHLNNIKIPQLTVVKPSVCDESKSATSMVMDETLMSANNKKRKAPILSEQEDTKAKKPLVASEQIRSAEGFDENKLSKMQKLYLQALELMEAIDKHEAEKAATEPKYPYPMFP
ncbi:unnamed protein product [Chironomus riparius]|uniref:Uncharacterized protein n=1 Tax=Chironomus riparius TaxID=315576 RepID=A0A9N9RZ46_9DIPT|nr:unnamed protein product [Chironomus riparius]